VNVRSAVRPLIARATGLAGAFLDRLGVPAYCEVGPWWPRGDGIDLDRGSPPVRSPSRASRVSASSTPDRPGRRSPRRGRPGPRSGSSATNAARHLDDAPSRPAPSRSSGMHQPGKSASTLRTRWCPTPRAFIEAIRFARLVVLAYSSTTGRASLLRFEIAALLDQHVRRPNSSRIVSPRR